MYLCEWNWRSRTRTTRSHTCVSSLYTERANNNYTHILFQVSFVWHDEALGYRIVISDNDESFVIEFIVHLIATGSLFFVFINIEKRRWNQNTHILVDTLHAYENNYIDISVVISKTERANSFHICHWTRFLSKPRNRHDKGRRWTWLWLFYGHQWCGSRTTPA